MELKLRLQMFGLQVVISLNRTFYGIETNKTKAGNLSLQVLIVPFMELKQLKQR